MKKHIKLFAFLLSFCILLTSCTSAGDGKSADSGYSQEVQNLEKLCKVWGYTKYTHPAFLLGEKDWDEELLNLIPVVSKAKEKEVNDILHEWFVGLGEIDYATRNRVPKWAAAKEEDKIVQANIDWICTDYLGEELTEDLSQLGPIPNINRSKAPVRFDGASVAGFAGTVGVADFSNESLYLDMDYSNPTDRLLGVFRVWNVIEYYFPYLDMADESWEAILPAYISKIMEQSDKNSYYLTLLEMLMILHDGHITLWDNENVLFECFGDYAAPAELTMVGKDWVVLKVWDSNCELQQGDIIKKVNNIEVEKAVEEVKRYVSIPNDEKLVKNISPWLLRSKEPTIRVNVVRDGEEILLEIDGQRNYYPASKRSTISHQLLEENIGVIYPSQVKDNEIYKIMQEFQDTEGLIIDLREYPAASDFYVLTEYIMNLHIATYTHMASQAVPGTFIKEKQLVGNASPDNVFNQQRGIYQYDGNIVVLIDQRSQSSPEWYALILKGSEKVTLLGNNTLGSLATASFIPLPGGNQIMFTSVGMTTADGKEVQRVGVHPDIEVYPTIEGIKEGRDELMEAAVAYIQEQNGK